MGGCCSKEAREHDPADQIDRAIHFEDEEPSGARIDGNETTINPVAPMNSFSSGTRVPATLPTPSLAVAPAADPTTPAAGVAPGGLPDYAGQTFASTAVLCGEQGARARRVCAEFWHRSFWFMLRCGAYLHRPLRPPHPHHADDDTTPRVEDEDAPEETSVEEEETRGGSMRLGFGQHGSYFAGIGQRMLHAAVEEVDDSTSTEEREYTDGYEIEHDGQHICTIAGRLGKGAMGTVYRAQSRDGREFAVKAVSADKSPAEIAEMQGQLALETSIGFAMGRHPLIASVIGVVVVVPGSKTTAKGLLLLCGKIDCGDLEGAMSSKEAVRIQKPDYAGSLWSEPSATTWPLASITLQIFIGFTHVHERGVLHQVRSQPEQIFSSSRLLLEVHLVYSGWCVDQGMAGFF